MEGLCAPLIIWEVHVLYTPYHPPQLGLLPLRNFLRFQIYCPPLFCVLLDGPKSSFM